VRICLVLCFAGVLAAQAPAVGIFEGQSDVGTVLKPGSATFDAASNSYTITSHGENMWAAEDDFHFVWKKMSGDVTVTADIRFLTATGNAHKKGMLIVRRTLDPDSDYVDAALHVVGLTSMQSREVKGGNTREVQSWMASPRRMRLVKRGAYFFMYVAGEDGDFHLSGGSMKLELNEPFYVGLGVCAHDRTAEETVVFSNVEVKSGGGSGEPKLYSTLEAVPVQSTDRRSVYVGKGRMAGPVWSKDGKTLLFVDDGKLRSIVAVGGKPVAVPAGALDQLNAHSAISVDGTLLAVTEAAKGRRAVYTLPAGGGTPVRLTRQDAQFEAWTPDGGLLLSGKRKKKETFFKVGLPGGSESPVQLGAGTNANPGYSPDGKFIYFDSDRSGSRQIWRMAADGTGAEQITTDEFLNSTPRVSPDGLQVAFLSVGKGGPEGAETDMKVRSVILATKAVRVISNMVGGVGSLGSAPWSPDGRTLTYVSYQLAPE